MTKHYRAFDIKYDTSGENPADIADTDFPKEVVVELDDDEDPSFDIADRVSDKTGWCINSCSFEQVPAPAVEASTPTP